jgi:hypothetical protein
MGRLIEVQDAQSCQAPLVVSAGDMLLFHASGGHIRSGGDVLEMMGPFLSAVLGDDGSVLAPMGAPNTVLFLARRPGRAAIDVVTGDPWHGPRTMALDIAIE